MFSNEYYQSIPPKSAQLSRYLKLYYVHSSDDPDYHRKIIYYPNYTSTLNIYKNSGITWTANSRTHRFSSQNQLLKILVGKINKSREIITIGPFNKMAIVFHPLGLNHFIRDPGSALIKEHFSFFDHYGKQFDNTLEEVFAAPSIEQKRDLLDHFFNDHFSNFAEQRLIQAVQSILAANDRIRVEQLAQQLSISRKTLLRLFRKHPSRQTAFFRS